MSNLRVGIGGRLRCNGATLSAGTKGRALFGGISNPFILFIKVLGDGGPTPFIVIILLPELMSFSVASPVVVGSVDFTNDTIRFVCV